MPYVHNVNLYTNIGSTNTLGSILQGDPSAFPSDPSFSPFHLQSQQQAAWGPGQTFPAAGQGVYQGLYQNLNLAAPGAQWTAQPTPPGIMTTMVSVPLAEWEAMIERNQALTAQVDALKIEQSVLHHRLREIEDAVPDLSTPVPPLDLTAARAAIEHLRSLNQHAERFALLGRLAHVCRERKATAPMYRVTNPDMKKDTRVAPPVHFPALEAAEIEAVIADMEKPRTMSMSPTQAEALKKRLDAQTEAAPAFHWAVAPDYVVLDQEGGTTPVFTAKPSHTTSMNVTITQTRSTSVPLSRDPETGVTGWDRLRRAAAKNAATIAKKVNLL